jgi:hypothetical protein
MISKCARGYLGLLVCFLGICAATVPLFGQVQQGVRQPPRMPATANRSNEPTTVKIRLEGTDLVGEIRNAPLQQVLEELAAWTGVVFEIESQENPPVSISFFRVSLEEAIQRLTGNNNSIMYYERDDAGQNHVRFVRVFARAARPQAPTLHYIGTGAITKRSDDIVDSPDQALVVLAGSTNLLARQKAVEVLIGAKSPAAIQALKVAVSDTAQEIKVAAIEGLVTLGVHDAVPQIIPALKDANPGVRKSAVQAVGLLGDSANVKDLRPLLRDQDSSVAAAAEIAIQKLSVRCP